MKKLLVLTLVLGLASAASAVVIEVDKAIINPGDVATFSVVADDTGAYGAWIEVIATGTSSFGDLVVLPAAGQDAGTPDGSYAGYWGFSAASLNPAAPPEIGPQFTIAFTGGADGDSGTVTLMDGSGVNYVGEPVVVNVIPEPMTLGLLGLGGLFLRRRK